MLADYLAHRARHSRRQLAYKIGLDWHMPVIGYLIDVDRNRFADDSSGHKQFHQYDRRASKLTKGAVNDHRRVSKRIKREMQLPLF